MVKKYNTAFTVCFSVEHDFEDTADVPLPLLVAGALRRLANLSEEDPQGALEAFEAYDTYEIQSPKTMFVTAAEKNQKPTSGLLSEKGE